MKDFYLFPEKREQAHGEFVPADLDKIKEEPWTSNWKDEDLRRLKKGTIEESVDKPEQNCQN